MSTWGHGPTWTAKVTDDGREYLANVDGPNPPVPRQPNMSVTQQLVNDLIPAGGALRVPRKDWYDPDGVDYEKRARFAERYRKVPPGMRLVVSRIESELEIKLVDAPERANPPELVSVAVPERVARYHRAARDFRDRSERHEVSRDRLKRATRIIHAIAVEADRRGWSAESPTESKGDDRRTRSWTGAKNGHLRITAGNITFGLRLHEEGVHARGHWEEEVERYRNARHWSWYGERELPSGPYDTEATGQLRLELLFNGWRFSGRQSRWGDRQSWQLEEHVPHLFQEIEERLSESKRMAEEARIAAEKAAEEAKRRAEEREREWHMLMIRARGGLVAAHRAEQLRTEADAWHEAERLRRYCDALEAAYGGRPNTAEWLAWARSYAARLDPLAAPPTMPNPPDATPEALHEHLPGGWSAHGPEHGNHSQWSRST